MDKHLRYWHHRDDRLRWAELQSPEPSEGGPMTISTRLAAFAALGLGLAACQNPNVQPPIAGTSMGSAGESAARVATDQIPQSQREATSAGAATITGTAGGGESAGRPTIVRTGPGSPNQLGGGIPQEFRPSPVDRGRGGGG